jgi:hypothetical protein
MGDDGGNQSDATFPGIAFFRNSDDHSYILSMVVGTCGNVCITTLTAEDTGDHRGIPVISTAARAN